MKIYDVLFLIAFLVGVVFYVRQIGEVREMKREHDALASEFGTFDIQDPGKVYVTRVKTNDPMLFQWRVYIPPNKMFTLVDKAGGSSGGGGSGREANESLITIGYHYSGEHFSSFRQVENWKAKEVESVGQGGGGTSGGICANETARFLSEHWNELDITEYSDNGRQAVEPGAPITLLRIGIPERLQDKFKLSMEESVHGQWINSFLVADWELTVK